MSSLAQTVSQMSDDERRGFDLACDTLILWAVQIEKSAEGLSQSGITVPLDQQMKNSAKFTQNLTQAMRNTATRPT